MKLKKLKRRYNLFIKNEEKSQKLSNYIIPIKKPTKPVFGGKSLNIIYITSINNDGNVSEYISDPTNENSLLTSETGKILVTKKGEVWAASKYGGVTVLDQSNNFTRYENDNLSLNSIIPEKINTIYEDNNGTIWLASLKGVSKFIEGKFKSFYYNPALKNDHISDINAFLYDNNKILWVGTNNNGLYTLDYEDLSIIEHYTLDQNNKHSFSSSTVLCIYEDSNDMVWIGTGCLLYTSPSPRDS